MKYSDKQRLGICPTRYQDTRLFRSGAHRHWPRDLTARANLERMDRSFLEMRDTRYHRFVGA